MDVIRIEELEVFANHGVLKEENALGQKFLVSADIFLDLKAAAEKDDISLSADYAQVCRRINSYLCENTFMLIETAAQRTMELLLAEFPNIYRIDMELKKPWAPIGLPVKYVSVKMSEKRHKAYLSLGSNMGDRKAYLDQAVKAIDYDALCRVVKVSDYIETKPVGGVAQDDFLNCALCIETVYSPKRLLKFLNGIELAAHRERKVHWGPRTLDIDIIFYDDIVLESEELTIPHIEAEKRGFVMLPMAQIAPEYVHPVSGRKVCDIAKSNSSDTPTPSFRNGGLGAEPPI